MTFNLLLLEEGSNQTPGLIESWIPSLTDRVPDVRVFYATSVGEAMEMIGECDAAFGTIVPELLSRAKHLKWIASPQAGPKAGYYYRELIDSNVVVTNTREIYNEHISQHIMMMILSFSKGLHHYVHNQIDHIWEKDYSPVYLPESTVLIVGVGGIGTETARLCSEFGMTVIGLDPRLVHPPSGVQKLHKPEHLDSLLPDADFVVVTVPETPSTQKFFDIEKFRLMKNTAFFINIGRGATVVLNDLAKALNENELRGAGLDVYEIEPLPPEHALWDIDNVILTPHCAAAGPYLDDRRTELFLDNCERFDKNLELRNIVDKANWF